MPLPELFLALLFLLLTPGPTNTLIALAGAERGVMRALRLIPAEITAYVLTSVPLAIAGAEILAAFPALRSAITLVAALWVAWLAVKLWRTSSGVAGETAMQVTGLKIFTTTLLNPKAVIIGLVLLPAESGMVLRALVFVGLVTAAAAIWAMIGSTVLRATQTSHMPLIRRVGAGWLSVLSISLVGAVFAA